ncbi:hypothetical protein Tco_1493284 [Tanacetum coccineum]
MLSRSQLNTLLGFLSNPNAPSLVHRKTKRSPYCCRKSRRTLLGAVMMVAAWLREGGDAWQRGGGGWRVAASGIVDQIDRVTGRVSKTRQKNGGRWRRRWPEERRRQSGVEGRGKREMDVCANAPFGVLLINHDGGVVVGMKEMMVIDDGCGGVYVVTMLCGGVVAKLRDARRGGIDDQVAGKRVFRTRPENSPEKFSGGRR